MPDNDAYQRYYREGGSARFDQLRLDRESEIDLLTELILQRAEPPGRVLDLGCGTGRYGLALRSEGFGVIGVDSSPDQIRHCQGLIEARLADATDLPFPDGHFDVCLSVLMFHQLPSGAQRQAINESARILRRGGLAAIKTCSEEDLRARPFSSYFPSALRINEERYPAIEFLQNSLEEAGIQEVETEQTHTVAEMPVENLLASLSARPNTTLALIPPRELQAGVERLREDLADQATAVVDHRHTVIFGRRS